MKKKVLLLCALFTFFGEWAYAQKSNKTNQAISNGFQGESLQLLPNRPLTQGVSFNSVNSSSTVLWSEDFANGFSASTNGTWTTSGANSSYVQYDFNGPDNLIPNGWGPLPSPTSANGFAIFDFYNRFPDPNGFATSPAEAYLTSPVISLSPTDTAVELHFYQQLFWCCEIDWEAHILISTDGGVTFTDTVVANLVDRNLRHWDLGFGYEFKANISDAIKSNPANIVLRFDWTSQSADANGQYSNTYFWMIDDIELRVTPANSLELVASQSAPATDIIYNGTNNYPRYGTMHVDQIVPIHVDANIVNSGIQPQTNVNIAAEVRNKVTGNLVTTLTAAGCGTLQPGDTCFYQNLTTNSWTPPATDGQYEIIYKVVSDSIPVAQTTDTDTISQYVSSNLYALDRKVSSNFVGTNSSSTNIIAMSGMYSLENEYADSVGSGLVFVDGATMAFSGLTDSTASLEFAIYDSTGYPSLPGAPVFTRVFTLDGSAPGNTVFFPFSSVVNGDTVPLSLPTNTYYLQVSFFTNAPNGVIRVPNDASVEMGSNTLMQLADGNWYNGFTTSTYEAPHIRLRMYNPGSCSSQRFETVNQCGGTYTSPAGNVYSVSGIYNDTLQNVAGCDSIIVTNLTIGTPTLDTITAQACGSGYTSPAGNFYTQSGTYNDTLTTVAGCDSIINIQLSLNVVLRDTINPVVACAANYMSPSGNYVYTSSGTYSDTLIGVGGCDSIVRVNLTITSPSFSSISPSVCANSFTSPSGRLFSQSGNYIDTLTNFQGCDSIVTINLLLLPMPDSTVVRVGDTLISGQPGGTYQWYECSAGFTPLPGDTNRRLILTATGNFTVITSNGTCTDTSACISVSSIGLPDGLQNSVSLFPNPTTGKVTLDLGAAFQNIEVQIFSVDGKQVLKNFNESATSLELDIPGPSGIYLLKLKTGDGQEATFNIQKRN